jgi:ElaB/YqjD/DUF883 family membrane-anchored ribosome-binding protein
MTKVKKRPTAPKKGTNQKEEADLSSDLKKLKENAANRQYEHVQDLAKDAVQESGEAIRRNPLAAVATALGLGFLFGLFKRRG